MRVEAMSTWRIASKWASSRCGKMSAANVGASHDYVCYYVLTLTLACNATNLSRALFQVGETEWHCDKQPLVVRWYELSVFDPDTRSRSNITDLEVTALSACLFFFLKSFFGREAKQPKRERNGTAPEWLRFSSFSGQVLDTYCVDLECGNGGKFIFHEDETWNFGAGNET